MSNSDTHVFIRGFLVVEPTINSLGQVSGAKFAKITGRAPQMDGDQRAVHISMSLPKSVFYPVAEVKVEVDEVEVVYPEVEVLTP